MPPHQQGSLVEGPVKAGLLVSVSHDSVFLGLPPAFVFRMAAIFLK